MNPVWPSAFGIAAAAGGIWLHDFFEGETLLRDIALQRRLSAAPLADLDRKAASAAQHSSAIVSLTSIPSRLDHIATTLKSLLAQDRPPATIHLNLPTVSRREQCEYVVPSWLEDLTMVRIHRCDDLGPATKLLPTLKRVDPDQLIVVVDDDRIYHANLIADLEHHADAEPDTAFGFSGWTVPDDLTDRPTTVWSNLAMRPPAPIRARRLRVPRTVDILQGMSGYAVRPRLFADLDALWRHDDAPPAAFFVDDVWISAHLAGPRKVIPARRANFTPWGKARFYKASSLGLANRGDGDPERRNNTIMIRHFADAWPVGGKRPC